MSVARVEAWASSLANGTVGFLGSICGHFILISDSFHHNTSLKVLLYWPTMGSESISTPRFIPTSICGLKMRHIMQNQLVELVTMLQPCSPVINIPGAVFCFNHVGLSNPVLADCFFFYCSSIRHVFKVLKSSSDPL